jgi:iron complex outermembrane receptor protein
LTQRGALRVNGTLPFAAKTMQPTRGRACIRSSVVAAAVCAALAAGHALAAVRQDHVASLADLSLEQLANVVVTSATRRAQPLGEAAASVYVITSEDIRRSGVRTLPEALRLAPNLTVARTDANNYAISARGFANVLANRLLVMIDGRTVFSPLFSGVFWDAQEVMLEDVDRIEVIDGPAGTMWGTNAVHGVINVITRSAQATQGTLLAGGGGNQEWGAAARQGGRLADGTAWRIFARGFGAEPSRFADGTSVGDRSSRGQAGFRVDGPGGRDQWTVQGDLYVSDVDQGAVTRDLAGGNVLGRWQRTIDANRSFTLQAYYDRTEREHPGTFRATLDTIDVEAQGSLRASAAQTLLLGAGYRFQRDRTVNSAQQTFLPPDRNLDTFYAVVQDEIDLGQGVAVIAGLKGEHNEYTGFEALPTLRVRWHPDPQHTVWAAASRAVRAPARIDRDYYLPGVPPYILVGNDSFQGEVTNVFEAGARGSLTPRITWSLTAYHHDHDRLRSIEPTATGQLAFGNGIEGTTTGFEGWATWQAATHWRLALGGMEMRKRLRVKPGVTDIGGLAALGNDPRRQYLLRSSLDLLDNFEFDVVARYVGERPNPRTPDYAAFDARLGWRVTRDVEVSLTLSNLGDAEHPEWGPAGRPAEYPRAWFLKVAAKL